MRRALAVVCGLAMLAIASVAVAYPRLLSSFSAASTCTNAPTAEAALRWAREELVALEAAASVSHGGREPAFTSVYDNHAWGHADPSGPGSTLRATQRTREWLAAIIRKHNITSVLDAPCGSFNWMRQVPWEKLGCRYVGVDIVAKEVDALRAQFAGNPWVSFYHADIVRGYEFATAVPGVLEQQYDLVFTRQAMQHLRKANALRALQNLVRVAPRKGLVATTYPGNAQNGDIPRENGGLFFYNLQAAPFNMPKADEVFDEQDGPLSRLMLWKSPITPPATWYANTRRK